MSEELNPERPLPWKAVKFGSEWDVTNDAGDPREEYSVLNYATEGEARFIVRAVNAHADLLAVARLALVMFCDPHSVSVDPAARNLKALAEAAIAKATGAA